MRSVKTVSLFLQELSELVPGCMVTPNRISLPEVYPAVIIKVHDVNVKTFATAEDYGCLRIIVVNDFAESGDSCKDLKEGISDV